MFASLAADDPADAVDASLENDICTFLTNSA